MVSKQKDGQVLCPKAVVIEGGMALPDNIGAVQALYIVTVCRLGIP